ncbi:MAG: chemotaxis protein CheW, partial [Myxococcota bacterium]
RGRVLPVIDPKLRFRMGPLVPDELTVAVVMETENRKPVGVLVDEVLEVHLISETELADAPDVACSEQQEFLSGVGNLGDRVVFVLDLDALLPSLQSKDSSCESRQWSS